MSLDHALHGLMARARVRLFSNQPKTLPTHGRAPLKPTTRAIQMALSPTCPGNLIMGAFALLSSTAALPTLPLPSRSSQTPRGASLTHRLLVACCWRPQRYLVSASLFRPLLLVSTVTVLAPFFRCPVRPSDCGYAIRLLLIDSLHATQSHIHLTVRYIQSVA